VELKEACERIGAIECMVLDRQDIRDNPKLWWDKAIVTPIVTSWVAKWKADAVCLTIICLFSRRLTVLGDNI
jgi:N-acetylglucosaminylphosphatidylinositol deacetylase